MLRAIRAFVFEQVPYVFARQNAKQASSFRREPRELKIDNRGLLPGRNQQVGLFCEIIVYNILPMYLTKQAGSGTKITRIGRPAFLHWQPFDITPIKRFTIDTKQKRDAWCSVKYCQSARLPRQQSPGNPLYAGRGCPCIPPNDQIVSTLEQISSAEYVLFHRPECNPSPAAHPDRGRCPG